MLVDIPSEEWLSAFLSVSGRLAGFLFVGVSWWWSGSLSTRSFHLWWTHCRQLDYYFDSTHLFETRKWPTNAFITETVWAGSSYSRTLWLGKLISDFFPSSNTVFSLSTASRHTLRAMRRKHFEGNDQSTTLSNYSKKYTSCVLNQRWLYSFFC